jgi:3',5'-cyclic AMP phosphodiesterase CpdA
VRGPIVTALDPHAATIAVDTDPGADVTIDWGVSALDHHVTSPAGTHHELVLAEIPPRIRYRVHGGSTVTRTFSLHVAPSAGDTIRIGVYGDVRGGHDVHRGLVGAMLAEGLDLVCTTGDMVLRGSDEADWQKFFAVTGELLAQMPYLPALGNHDVGWTGTQLALPPPPPDRPADTFWYSTEIADIHLVFLDSNAYDREEQEKWLDADLAAARARKVRAILVFTHEGPYARGTHRGNSIARDRYVPILARHQVDLLLAGHDHLYQRGEAGGIRYVVTGGGGAGLYDPSCGVAHKPACDEDGMQKLAIEHHFVVLTIDKHAIQMCARRADDSLLEPCTRYAL